MESGGGRDCGGDDNERWGRMYTGMMQKVCAIARRAYATCEDECGVLPCIYDLVICKGGVQLYLRHVNWVGPESYQCEQLCAWPREH
eukprot:34880-Eustigmatos_ZCMA.PRE.1